MPTCLTGAFFNILQETGRTKTQRTKDEPVRMYPRLIVLKHPQDTFSLFLQDAGSRGVQREKIIINLRLIGQ